MFILVGQGCVPESLAPQNEPDDIMMEADEPTDEDVMMEDKDEMTGQEAMSEGGTYETYSADKLARAENGDVILFFRASWCPTCKALDANIKANLGDIPDDLTILDVDYDNSTELKQKYGVTYQHTLVQVDADGNLIKKWSGSPSLATILAEVE